MEFADQLTQLLESKPWIIAVISLWEAFWTLLALWFAGRNDQKGWFVVCGIFQVFGLPEIIYLATQTRFFKNFNINE